MLPCVRTDEVQFAPPLSTQRAPSLTSSEFQGRFAEPRIAVVEVPITVFKSFTPPEPSDCEYTWRAVFASICIEYPSSVLAAAEDVIGMSTKLTSPAFVSKLRF